MSNSNRQNLFSHNSSSFNVTNNYTTVSDEESRILSWISPLESWKRHSDVARARAKGVGEWVMQSSEFQTWRQDANDRAVSRILFGCGAPGAGKTFICSLGIDTLCDGTTGTNTAVGCLYCDYGSQKEQTPEVMIGSLLRQFVTALPEIPQAIRQAFRVAKTHLGGRAPELAKIIELFPPVLQRFQQVFICVDALDEFAVEYRAGFLRSLCQILDQSPNAKLFLTARPHIEPELERYIPLNVSIITIQPLVSDIEMYLRTKLDTDPHHGAMDNCLRSEILTKILKESSEIFLLVTLQIDSILEEVTIGGRRKKLREMTDGLGDSYTGTLNRIRGQRGTLARFGISALMWISLAERPLLIDELCHAMAVEFGSPNVNTEMVPEIETVVASCMGLVTIDHVSSTVRLIHATLEEYLHSHQEDIFQNPHAIIAEVCLSYLGIQSVQDLPSYLEAAPPTFPLLGYASCHWGAHARKELRESVRNLALETLEQYPRHAAANIFLSNGGAPWRWPGSHSAAGFSGLHYVAYFGIDELSEALLNMARVDLNLTDEWGRTPLILAAERGNGGVVRTLINRAGVNPNLADRRGKTPLFQASVNGHEEVVRILLSHADVNPNVVDRYDRTPLSQAFVNGHEGVIMALLNRADTNLSSADWSHQTILSQASANGHESVVRALLSRTDINPNLADLDGQTPLLRASSGGHEGIVSALLSHTDVNPNSADRLGQTPLFQASANGHEEVVKILLSHAEVNPDLADQYGRTPLSQASANGHERVVRILLSHADINPNSANHFGTTPLSLACGKGHEGVVKILLSCADVNPNSADRLGRTPLFRASTNGHEGAIMALLNRADINPSSADQGCQTLLSQASANGHESVVGALLNRADVNPNSADQFGQTPLFLASANGHEGVARALIRHADVNPNSPDRGNRTPLFQASANGLEGVVKALLSRADVNPNLPDESNQTPLFRASANGHEEVVRALLSRADVNPNLPDMLDQTPLFQASANGHEGVVRILLSRADVDSNIVDMFGHTPLRRAAFRQHHVIVSLLQARQ